MTTPTIFSDKASRPLVWKSEPQGVTYQTSNVFVPSGTVSGTLIGMIRFDAPFTLVDFKVLSAALGAGVTLDVGFALDATAGEALDC
jgi:hypothetical protein